jgi:hypothetical protein
MNNSSDYVRAWELPTYLRLPAPVEKLVVVAGRIFAHLEDGSTIDCTDWFSEDATRN